MPGIVDPDKGVPRLPAKQHASATVEKTFELVGVRDDHANRPFPSVPLPNSDDSVCRGMSLAMAKTDAPTVSPEELKSAMQHLQLDVCSVNGVRMLTFAEVLNCARRRGLPLRFDQAWGTARHMWFQLNKETECAMIQLLQAESEIHSSIKDPVNAEMLIRHAWLLEAIRECTADRPMVHIESLKRHLNVFLEDHTEIDLIDYIDNVSKAGLPIKRSRGSRCDVYVWFYFCPLTLNLVNNLPKLPGLNYHQRHKMKLNTDRYVTYVETEAKQTSSTAATTQQISHALTQGRTKPAFAHIQLPLTHYDVHEMQNADRLASIWMQINPGRYQDNATCVKLIIVLVRTVAVRQSWHHDQKRLYMDLIVRRVRMWAPELIENGLTNAFQTAQKLGTSINWSPGAKRINVARLLAPIRLELRQRSTSYRPHHR